MFKPPMSLVKSFATTCKTAWFSTASKPHFPPAIGHWPSFDIHPEVEEALAKRKPIVALETALVTHGFARPHNLETAIALQDIVRSTGAIPATIGLIKGRVKIGLKDEELEHLAHKENVHKISRRDIAPGLTFKADGGTTCSATMIFAALAGIKGGPFVFATGGLGGVHRGGELSMDVSADLQELTRCPLAVVSSGVKSILDIRRTLEYLETLGVPVLTYGPTKAFPAFFTRDSGFNSPWNINDPALAARILYTQTQLGLDNGVLFAAPIPADFERDGLLCQEAVDQAVAESESNGVSSSGNDVTPWLLARVAELTQGLSVACNTGLLRNTALIGGQIATEYQKLLDEQPENVNDPLHAGHAVTISRDPDQLLTAPARLIVIGSAAIDVTSQLYSVSDGKDLASSTSPGTVGMTLGGVARNIAEASHRAVAPTGVAPLLISPVGDDTFGCLLMEETTRIGMRTDGMVKSDKRTAICNMMLDGRGELIHGVADMEITASLDGSSIIEALRDHHPNIAAFDANISSEAMTSLVQYSAEHGIDSEIAFVTGRLETNGSISILVSNDASSGTSGIHISFSEPTSVTKSASILPALATFRNIELNQPPITYISPNLLELAYLDRTARAEPYDLYSHPSWWSVIDGLELGSNYRTDLEQLARRRTDDDGLQSGTLSFLTQQGVAQMAVRLLPFFQHILVKCGPQGVIIVMRIPKGHNSSWIQKRTSPSQRLLVAHGKKDVTVLQHFPALRVEHISNVTGAGDSFAGAVLARLAQNRDTFRHPESMAAAIVTAQQAAVLALQSHSAVSSLI